MVRDEQTAQATEEADGDGQPDNLFKTVSEQVGGHLRNGEQRDCQHDAYHPQARYDGEGDEHHQQVFEPLHGNLLRAGELAIEGDADDGTDKKAEKHRQHDGQYAEHP